MLVGGLAYAATLDVEAQVPAEFRTVLASFEVSGVSPEGHIAVLAAREAPEGRITVEVDGEPLTVAAEPGAALDHIVQFISGRVVESADVLLLHAGLVSHANRGVLLVGASGAGKSTLVANLLAIGGFNYGTDEAVAVGVGTLTSYARPLVLKHGSLTAFPGLPGTPPLPGGRAFYSIASQAQRSADSVSPDLVLLLDRQEDMPGVSWSEVSDADAVMRVVPHSSHLADLPEGLNLLAGLMRRSACFVLSYGDAGLAAASVRDRCLATASLPRQRPGVLEERLQGEALLLVDGTVHRLNGTAAAVWALLPRCSSRDDLVAALGQSQLVAEADEGLDDLPLTDLVEASLNLLAQINAVDLI